MGRIIPYIMEQNDWNQQPGEYLKAWRARRSKNKQRARGKADDEYQLYVNQYLHDVSDILNILYINNFELWICMDQTDSTSWLLFTPNCGNTQKSSRVSRSMSKSTWPPAQVDH